MKFRPVLIPLLIVFLFIYLSPQFALGAADHLPGALDPSSMLGKWDSSLNPNEPGQTGAAEDELKIIVIEGEDGVNIIKKKTAVQPVVEVRDRNNLPVAGAVVVFATPSYGPSGVFLNGGRTLSVVTDASGRAAVSGMTPTGTGAFKINVTAHADSKSGTAVISQTNVAAAAATGAAAGISAAHWLIIGGAVAAAAAVGAVVAVNTGGGKPTGTIGAPGAPQITAPH